MENYRNVRERRGGGEMRKISAWAEDRDNGIRSTKMMEGDGGDFNENGNRRRMAGEEGRRSLDVRINKESA